MVLVSFFLCVCVYDEQCLLAMLSSLQKSFWPLCQKLSECGSIGSWISILPTEFYRCNCVDIILIKTPMKFFAEIKNNMLKFIWKSKRPRIVGNIVNNENTTDITILDFNLYYRVIVTVCYWCKNRYTDQWNSIENLDYYNFL